ncbi:MAG: 16S rRNA (guanine(966)-N(2))-methyltransferase RsmD [Propionibacteriaceae bacterium]|nr:16S rRNA (guanine(966)-N(2))-methyltransferase RsmD [Propionibacteriaceae bacterium]
MSRIIAGSLASRRFPTPKGSATRPTTDRVRESVFALLASLLGTANREASAQLHGFSFLDLFAGSGAMGLEAISRGAEAVFVDRSTARLIRGNCASLGVQAQVFSRDVEAYLAGPSTGFHIIWMDPPYEYDTKKVEGFLNRIAAQGWLESHGLVLVERSKRSSAVEFPESFLNISSRLYGETVIYLAEMR